MNKTLLIVSQVKEIINENRFQVDDYKLGEEVTFTDADGKRDMMQLFVKDATDFGKYKKCGGYLVTIIPVYQQRPELLAKDFHVSEFGCKDGTPVPNEIYSTVRELAENLQVLRDYLGEAIHINSAYRTESHNKAKGGKPQSLHLTGHAADICCKGKTPKQIGRTIELLIGQGKMKQGGLKVYNGFVHYDIRGEKARW